MLLQYGFGRCGPKEIQQLLYSMTLTDSDYPHIILMLILQIIFYRLLAIYILTARLNQIGNRKTRSQRIVRYRENLLKV